MALDYGKIDGKGYGNVISSTYGPECGEKAIIRIDWYILIQKVFIPEL